LYISALVQVSAGASTSIRSASTDGSSTRRFEFGIDANGNPFVTEYGGNTFTNAGVFADPNTGHLLVAKLTRDDWARTVPSMISAAIHDDEIRSLARAFSRERREAATAIVNEGARRGEIGAPDQIDAALERFVAPFFFRRILSFQPLDEAFIESQVAATLEQLEAAERPRPERS
jgi:hypothetical protein